MMEVFETFIKDIIYFLQSVLDTSSLKARFKCGTFNSYRSALFLISSRDLSLVAILKRCQKDIFKLRPSKPLYDIKWDSKDLLDYFVENLQAPLNLTHLSQKLIIVLALITGGRLQTISLIRLSNVQDNLEGLQNFNRFYTLCVFVNWVSRGFSETTGDAVIRLVYVLQKFMLSIYIICLN